MLIRIRQVKNIQYLRDINVVFHFLYLEQIPCKYILVCSYKSYEYVLYLY
jgi:hypothetical protein